MQLQQLLQFGPNAGYLTELYQLYQNDPTLVDPMWAQFFAGLESSGGHANGQQEGAVPAYTNGTATGNTLSKSATLMSREVPAENTASASDLALRVMDGYRRFGHFQASISPLKNVNAVNVRQEKSPPELEPQFYGLSERWNDLPLRGFSFGDRECSSVSELVSELRRFYCGTVGFDVMHISSTTERQWLLERIEKRPLGIFSAPRAARVLTKLVEGDLFEAELHRKYVGTKRFSLEGTETLIPLLDAVLSASVRDGVREVVCGMAHRGRLNVLTNTLGKPLEMVFSEFQDQSMATVVGAGDVKYHLGFEGTVRVPVYESGDGTNSGSDGVLRIQMVPNPSHLEFVNPVVEGVCRALQDDRYGGERQSVLPVLMHGDAAVAGQGIVFETLGYSLLDGYRTGGTLHIVINNQIGFTTTPDEGRSTTYCTDFAKGFDCPMFHVNSEDPEAAAWVAELAVAYRNRFGKDVFIDLIGYRKHGHNEGDDPSFTQPLTYAEIKEKRPMWQQYGDALVARGTADQAQIDSIVAEYKARFERAQSSSHPPVQGAACSLHGRLRVPTPETGVDGEFLKEVAGSLTTFPEGFTPHPKLSKIIEKRVETVQHEGQIEWGTAEALAYGSLMRDGKSIRLSGQDCRRGTFSQRHIVLDHFRAAEIFSPISVLSAQRGFPGRFEVHNSSLSEAGVLGFEFGYSSVSSNSLVMWEAQFGDFSNGAQVIIDQFIASSEAKWGQLSGVTLLLPHAYEGQGPEHSSARLERYLQLCGEGNMCVCYPSTSAQQFHLLRRQGLLEMKRPLVVMTPKSLLRLPAASSSFKEFTSGSFKPVLEDDLSANGSAKHVVIVTGKIYHDLMAVLQPKGPLSVKVVRIEQLHPFPQFEFKRVLKDMPSKKVIWLQEEPKNMGAWSYVQPYLQNKLELEITYVGREVSASTATGSAKHHLSEQKGLLDEVLRLLGA
jgi:2-oxoglutarate dehydrogenase E1 component